MVVELIVDAFSGLVFFRAYLLRSFNHVRTLLNLAEVPTVSYAVLKARSLFGVRGGVRVGASQTWTLSAREHLFFHNKSCNVIWWCMVGPARVAAKHLSVWPGHGLSSSQPRLLGD